MTIARTERPSPTQLGALLNGPVRPRPIHQTVVDLIDETIRRHPDDTAVIHPTGTLTYRDVDRLADAVTADLLAVGARQGDFVALLLDDRVGLLVAMLGTMRSGAAFVPFDKTWPTLRQVRMLDGLRPVAAVGSTPPDGAPDLPVIDVRTTPTTLRRRVPTTGRARPDDPIYAFFTSGSTGLPKCAVNLHHGLVNRFLSMTERFAADGAVVLQNSAHTFDSSIWQLLWPLTRGGTVVIPDRTGILDFDATLAQIHRHGVTMTDFVPSIFDLLVERLEHRPQDRHLLASMRQVFIGGEAAKPHTVQAFRRMFADIRVTNTYGPTEASIGSVFHAVTDDDRQVIPLGLPLPNTSVLLLDQHGLPTPRGEIGEIHLAGVCLGAGYHGDVQRTRQVFVPNPYDEVAGDLLYRTGDFGWVREDGLLMFSGRRDAQVQIAGMRVDLGEVECAITTLPGVHQVKVIVDDAGASSTMVCFYSADRLVTEDALRGHVRAALPAALVPGRFVRLATLPLLSNGKVDQERLRRRLAGTAPKTAEPEAGYPADSVEARIAEIWARVLGFSANDDDFYCLGGTSLGAARLAVEFERAFGIRLDVRDLIRSATIAAQAELVRRGSPLPPPAVAPHELADDLRLGELGRMRVRRPGDRGSILLVGATGFIGSHVLAALSAHGDRPIVCLVRATDDEAARHRVASGLAAAGYRPAELTGWSALAGDLEKPHLGLVSADWRRLCRQVGTLVDAGGRVDTLRDYADLRTTNVHGLRTLIHLAGTHVRKRIISLSTTTVRHAPGAPLAESFLPRWSALPPDGYSQSKWVGEQLLRTATEQGVPCAVVRLGEVAAHARTGHANPRSSVTMMLRLCLRLGVRPPTGLHVDWTPVDLVARVVAALTDPVPPGTVLNVVAPGSVPVSDLLSRLRTDAGALPEVPYDRFLDRAADLVGDDETARCLAVLRPRSAAATDALTGVCHDALVGTDTVRAARLARDLGLDWATRRDAEIDTMIDRLTRAHRSVNRPHLSTATVQ
ncbi:amino acid adenylation domain-containing protein [Micromonospora sp. WMMD1120]|uniref:amino acid adenylation domain-containing protein n=1 Tax=Micromonospora sp. WMMD1120 TaxID=3016106 RepID=UPI0024161A13|nr:amino acid adenylation domain-containing protein [Micromonospora sp. WMMD1120]MDG4806973.1 amino acid adenylation domain-containing protein [Micromonospora sp. WMMD1120]